MVPLSFFGAKLGLVPFSVIAKLDWLAIFISLDTFYNFFNGLTITVHTDHASTYFFKNVRNFGGRFFRY